MARHQGFNFFTHSGEQNLYEDIIVEAIRIYAHDMYYLPRTGVKIDNVMNEYESVTFNKALPVELYIKNTDAFEGDGQLLSKFGWEARDQMTLCMSKRSFQEYVQPTTGNPRPYEGDLIFVPMLNVSYQIKYVKTDSIFFTLGKLNMYEIVLDLFENSGEVFNTGLSLIDDIYPVRGNINDPDYDLESEDLDAANALMQTEADDVLDLSETDPFTSGTV